MLQDESSIGWDLLSLPRPLSLSLRIYALFLLIAVIVTMARLVTLWIAARLSRQANNPHYLQRLRTGRVSFKQWTACTLLAWGFAASVDLFQVSSRLLMAKTLGTASIVFAIRDFSVGPEMASLVALFLFLAQWHLLNRIASLSK